MDFLQLLFTVISFLIGVSLGVMGSIQGISYLDYGEDFLEMGYVYVYSYGDKKGYGCREYNFFLDKRFFLKLGRVNLSFGSGFWFGVLGFIRYRQTGCLGLIWVILIFQQFICFFGEVLMFLCCILLIKLKLSLFFIVV